MMEEETAKEPIETVKSEELSEAAQTFETSEAFEASEASEVSETSETPETSEASQISEIFETSEKSSDLGSEKVEDQANSTPSVPVSGDVGDLRGDLSELISFFPELYGTERLEELPKYARYRAMRAQGLTPQEAYYASNGDEIVKYRLDADRRRELRAQTSHLTSVVGQSEISEKIMSEREKRAARIALGYSASDAELERLWKRIHSGGEESI